MHRINKSLWIKFKTSISVFETINKTAFATEVRSLSIGSKSIVNKILSHPTLSDYILPNLIGLNKNSADWERTKLDYVSSLQLSVPLTGYKLDLNCTISYDDNNRKQNLIKYVKDNDLYAGAKKDELPSLKVLSEHIFKNRQLSELDYHQYFVFDNNKDYLYWIIAVNSSQVANTPEDVNKSSNIRFFLFDEKSAQKTEFTNISKEIEANNKLAAIKNKDDKESLLNIALVTKAIDYDEISDMDDYTEYIYVKLFKYSKVDPVSIINAIADTNLVTKANIRKYIETGIFRLTDEGIIINSSNEKPIGSSMEEAVKYFTNPINEGDVTTFAKMYKEKSKK